MLANNSPWGEVLKQDIFAEGIALIHTASDVGFLLSDERNEQMPECFRNMTSDRGAYALKTAWAFVYIVFPDVFGTLAVRSACLFLRSEYRDNEAVQRYVFEHYGTGTAPSADDTHPFAVGDRVTFTNDYGVVFRGKTVTGIEFWKDGVRPEERRYFFEPTDAPWCSVPGSNLKHED